MKRYRWATSRHGIGGYTEGSFCCDDAAIAAAERAVEGGFRPGFVSYLWEILPDGRVRKIL